MVNNTKSVTTVTTTKPKRTYKKKKMYKKNTKMAIPTAPKNFQLVKLKYAEEYNLSLTPTLASDWRLLRANDLYDPNYSGSGHQPYFRDQMYALYTKARVLSTKITVIFAPDTNQAVEIILCPLPEGIQETNFQLAKERKGTRSTIINLGKIKTLYAISSTARELGLPKKTVLTDDLFIQRYNAILPNEQVNWWQFGAKLLNPNASCTIACAIKLEMIALFSDAVQQTQS